MSNLPKNYNIRVRKDEVVLVGDVVSVSAMKFGSGFAKEAFPSDWESARYNAEIVSYLGKRKLLTGVERQYRIKYQLSGENDVVYESEIKFISRPAPQLASSGKPIIAGNEGSVENQVHQPFEEELDQNNNFSTLAENLSQPTLQPQQTLNQHPVVARAVSTTTSAETVHASSLHSHQQALSQVPEPHVPVFSPAFDNAIINTNYFSDDNGAPYPRKDPEFIDLLPEHRLSPLNLFFHMLPMDYFDNVVIPGTSSKLKEMGIAKLKKFEFLRYVGYRLAMSLFKVEHQDEYWTSEADELRCAPNLGKYGISRDRFKKISQCLSYYVPNDDEATPTSLKQVLRMYQEFNKHMRKKYSPSFCVCIDESMTAWTNRWSSAIWNYVPRKPTPMGTEVKNIADAMNAVVFVMEPVYASQEPKMFEDRYKKMCATMLRLTLEAGMWETPRVLIGDSAFTSLEAMVALHSHKIHSVFSIKKKLFWPKGIPGDELTTSVQKLTTVGSTYSRSGEVSDAFGHRVKFYLCGLKDYIPCLLLSNFGSLARTDIETKRVYYDAKGKKMTSCFFRPDLYNIYYKGRHAVDDSNNLRMGDRSIESSWQTKKWINRIFAFILGTVEANAYNAYKFNYHSLHPSQSKNILTHIQFRRIICMELFKYCTRMEHEAEVAHQNSVDTTNEVVAHKIKKFDTGTPRQRGSNKNSTRRSIQPQFVCARCPGIKGRKKPRTCFYCICDITIPLCKRCQEIHLLTH